MKVLFLDMDGVLNSDQSFVYHSQLAGKETPYRFHTLCPISVSNLQFIFTCCPDLRCVISSTWRKHFPPEQFEENLPFLKGKILGITPSVVEGQKFSERVIRGRQIEEFIRVWHETGKGIIEDYVILDDNADMGDSIGKLFLTDGRIGLTYIIAREVVKRLGGSEGIFFKGIGAIV